MQLASVKKYKFSVTNDDLTCENYVTPLNDVNVMSYTITPHYYVPRYYTDSDITRSVVDPDFLPPGENAKWACLNLLRIALTILKKH